MIMKKTWFAIATLLASFGFLPAAYGETIEVKSDNIIFVGDVPEEAGRRIVKNLEVFRGTILSLVGLENKPDRTPLRVYGSKNSATLGRYVGIKNVAGVYVKGYDGPVFVTVTRGNFKGNKWSTQVALHEYGHHVLHALSRDNFPRWYDEGFANYFSTFTIDEDIITIGAPTLEHGTSLKSDRWMTPETVLSSVRSYPKRGWINQFYGQSWLYVHYMQNHPEMGKKLPTYLAALKTESDPLKAFETSFGISVKDFNAAARAYWNKNEFSMMQFKGSDKLLNPKISVRTLDETEAEFAYAIGQTNFMNPKMAKKLKPLFDRYATIPGYETAALEGRAHTAITLKNYHEASVYAKALVAAAPGEIEGYRYSGDTGFHILLDRIMDERKKHEIKTFPQGAELQTVISNFEKALEINPLDYTSITHLITLYGRSDTPVSSAAKNAAENLVRYYLTDRRIGEYIDVAHIKMRSGQGDKGCEFYGFAKAAVDGYKNKKVNDDYARVDAFKEKYPQCAEL